MNKKMNEELLKSLFLIKHIIFNFHSCLGYEFEEHGLNINEIILMRDIQYNAVGSNNNKRISDIQSQLFVSKAAVSKMLGVLEKKGYICRDIDKENRRNLIITLTQEGKGILKKLEQNVDELVARIIQQLGKDQAEQFIKSVNNFATTTDDIEKFYKTN